MTSILHIAGFQRRFLGKSLGAVGKATTDQMSQSLESFDPALYQLIAAEQKRQAESINLIASENFTPRYCSDALASCASMKYSEGLPGDRYYAGNENIDKMELLCQKRCLEAFHLDSATWDVSVQPHSGSPANFSVYTGLLKPGDRILFMNLPHGGHLSHGFGSGPNPLTATAKYFTTKPYFLNPETELIDYDQMEKIALEFKPHLIIAGASAYSREIDYKRFRSVADACNAILMADIAHIAGLIAADVFPSPFEDSDIVTTTTHKTLRGPRGALIFMRKQYAPRIHKAVFPGCQGGPHNHSIAAIAAAMLACTTPEFRAYQSQVLKNAGSLAKTLQKNGIRLATGGTDNHLILADLSPLKITGSQGETILEKLGIITNRNTLAADKSPKKPTGIRLGTPCMTSRGMDSADFEEIGELICQAATTLGQLLSKKSRKAAAFNEIIHNVNDYDIFQNIKSRAKELAVAFPTVQSAIWKNPLPNVN